MCLQHEIELAIVARTLVVTVPPEPVAPLGREDCLPCALHRGAARRIHEIATLLGERVADNGPPGGDKSRPPNLLLLLTAPRPEVRVNPASRMEGAQGDLRADLGEEVPDPPCAEPTRGLGRTEILVEG